MKRRAVASYLFGIVVNRDPETFMGVTSRLGLEDQIIANDPQRFQIGRAGGVCMLLLKPALFFCGIRPRCGSILSFGHSAFKRHQIA
jgi:hypothetical protein